ncbi:MAG TPA: sigma-70 region 4 domain-containing protein [Candidatus Onthocola gallistercoris]|uniref:Sigma-70 region 4 domain-containing protein n=1 Tax=Candidatus Onthocola gallistercoris TaxID=2840876 RepID=A0A9D1HHK3_9FIRM|nr:sigma-70 region 4 domain-containing protein [Candidatus Onthocola gallistercoris]
MYRLQMYFFDGLTYEEIAVREGCSYQAVQKSIAAALKKSGNF